MTRQTKRSWMRDVRYVFDGPSGTTFNAMEAAERICNRSAWNKVVGDAIEKHPAGGAYSSPPSPLYTARKLWWDTMESRGGVAPDLCGIRIRKSWSDGSSGFYREGDGVTVSASSQQSEGSILAVILHETVHAVLAPQVRVSTSAVRSDTGAVRRPHDLCFNVVLTRMAKGLWGYPFHPLEVGFSLGRGYAPQRHLEGWIAQQIEARNPRVTTWVGLPTDSHLEE